MAKLETFGTTPDNAGKAVDVTTEHGYPTGLKRQDGRLLTQEQVAARTLDVLEQILEELKTLNEVASNLR